MRLKSLRNLAAGLVAPTDDVHRCLQAGGGRCFTHLADHCGKRIEQNSLTRSGNVWKKPAFNRVVLGAVAWIVGHADLDSQIVHQILQVLFEKILRGGIASAGIAQQKHGRGVRVTLFADAVPVPAKTVAGELAGIVIEPDVDVATVADLIIDAVGNDDAGGPTREVVVECLERLLRPHAARAGTVGPDAPWLWCPWKTRDFPHPRIQP